MHKILTIITFIAVSTFACAGYTQTIKFDSVYTDLDWNECTVIEADDFGARWACPGYKGIPVMIFERDLKFFVSYGLDSLHEKAAKQTLDGFSTIGTKIEWRLSNKTGEWKPAATILRFFVSKNAYDDEKNQILVVTKIEQGATCHIAHIRAIHAQDATILAREATDRLAHTFECETDKIEKKGDL